MMQLLQTPVGRLRLAGFAEGISLLVLFFIAMPLKYFGGKPEAVRIVGWIHGLLFILFIVAAYIVSDKNNWPRKKFLYAFIAAFLPFGTFVFDKQLRNEEGN